MNLALGAVLLAILLIPPLVFLFFYRTGNHAKAAPKLTILEYLLLSAVLSLFLHGLIIAKLKLPVNHDFLLRLISGNLTDKYIENIPKNNLETYLKGFVKYIFYVCLASALSGFIVKYISTRKYFRRLSWLQTLRKDRKPSFFNYYNDWWYFFQMWEYNREYSYLRDTEPVIYTDVLVDTKDATIIYSGILQDFITDGVNLDRIYLINASRRLFQKKDFLEKKVFLKEDDEVKMIRNGVISISSSKIINIYIRFAEIVIENDVAQTELPDEESEEVIGSIDVDDFNVS